MEKAKGYVMLPCFKVEIDRFGECNMTCNRFLSWVFDWFFSYFWTGKIHIIEGAYLLQGEVEE